MLSFRKKNLQLQQTRTLTKNISKKVKIDADCKQIAIFNVSCLLRLKRCYSYTKKNAEQNIEKVVGHKIKQYIKKK